jgi:hypothetical protein
MKYLALLTLLISALFYSACSVPATGNVDPLITEQDADAQNYNLTTTEFKMQVAIRSDVGGNPQNILDILDQGAAAFLQCQFSNTQLGFQTYNVPPSGQAVAPLSVVPPLSMLRVFVVPFTFHCQAEGTDTCSGVFFTDSDLIVISAQSLGRCGQFPLLRHELGHRYGMALDHSNIAEFQSCISTPDCFYSDFINFFGVGG